MAVKVRRPKPVPQRTCVGCRGVQGKRELVRVVRTPEGEVVVDVTGRRNGRGAYVHKSRECWELALKRGALERALKVTISPDARQALTTYGCELPSAPPETGPAASEDGAGAVRAAEVGRGNRHES